MADISPMMQALKNRLDIARGKVLRAEMELAKANAEKDAILDAIGDLENIERKEAAK